MAAAARTERLERAGLRVWSALEYGGAVASLIGAFKDGGRTDAASVLAPALRASISAALGEATGRSADVRPDRPRASPAGGGRPAGLHVVTVPSTPAAHRARGYRPVPLLLRRCGIVPAPVLVLARDREDQAGLDAHARRANAEGALRARESLAGRRILLVDDVLTTGSTLLEAARAVRAAGGLVEAVAVLAQTPLRLDPRSASSR